MANRSCPKCKGSGMVKDPDGMCHTCWDCLASGNMDTHSKNVKDSGVVV